MWHNQKEDLTMKEKYTAPEMEIVEFETEDIITNSINGDNNTPQEPIS